MFKKEVNQSQFKSLLKYAVTYGLNPNCDRCNVVDVVLDGVRYSMTVCFNEKKNQVVICEIFKVITKIGEYKGKMTEIDYRNPDGEEESEELKERCFNELLRLASGDWTVKENDKWKYEFYKEKIQSTTKCCELNQ
jgi:hypothetical protein